MCFRDATAPSIYRESHPRARKAHACCECGAVIPVGAVHQLVTGLWDGNWDSYRTCASCEAERDRITALEVAEGCHGTEAIPPFGELAAIRRDYEGDRA